MCIDFEIARWKFDIDSKVVEFLLQENEHTHAYIHCIDTYTHTQIQSYTLFLCPSFKHTVYIHLFFTLNLCSLTHIQSMCVCVCVCFGVFVSKWIIDARTHFPGRKIQKRFCTHVPRNKHTISVHLERGHIQHIYIHAYRRCIKRWKACECVCNYGDNQAKMYKHTHAYNVDIKYHTCFDTGTIFTIQCSLLLLLLLLQTFLTSIQYGELFSLSSFYLYLFWNWQWIKLVVITSNRMDFCFTSSLYEIKFSAHEFNWYVYIVFFSLNNMLMKMLKMIFAT